MFGPIHTYPDPTRESTRATLRLNSDGTYTEDFYFAVLADVPGVGTLRGVQELHLSSKRVHTFNPHQRSRPTRKQTR